MKKCPICGVSSKKIDIKRRSFFCLNCSFGGKLDALKDWSFFDHITLSPEKLSENFIYCLEKNNEKVWFSTIVQSNGWKNYEDAINHTIERLNQSFYKKELKK